MSKVIRKLLELADSPIAEQQDFREKTKHPHISAGVMLLVGDGLTRESQFKKAFGEVVSDLQRFGYLKKGTLKSTAKGIKLSNAIVRTERFGDLMDGYEELLDKFRDGGSEPYRGRVPIR